jgi:hypothetical protein
MTKVELARSRAKEERQMAQHYRRRADEFRELGDADESSIRNDWAIEADLEAEIFEDAVVRLESLDRETI